MAITAALVKELRERTGAGMMDCKKALSKTDGDIDAAIDLMRKSGAAKADKKSSRVAAEGAVIVEHDSAHAVIVEVNCETDFVSGGDDFKSFAREIAKIVLQAKPADVSELASCSMGDKTVDETRLELIAKIGENIQVRRFGILPVDDVVGDYVHGNNKIGVIITLSGGDEALARDLAMHVAWTNPKYLGPEDVPAEMQNKEKEILVEQARAEGKPVEIIEKMVAGRMRKYLDEISLLGQPFVKEPKTSVGKLIKGAGASISQYIRLEVGEGIEKKTEDFAAEVMAQVRGE